MQKLNSGYFSLTLERELIWNVIAVDFTRMVVGSIKTRVRHMYHLFLIHK
jgi:hypothetical protein